MARRKKKNRWNISGYGGSASMRGRKGSLLDVVTSKRKDPTLPDINSCAYGRQADADAKLAQISAMETTRRHARLPDLGAGQSGRRDQGTPDLGAGQTSRRDSQTPDLGAGQTSGPARGAPNIGAGQGRRQRSNHKGVPDLGASGKRASSKAPDIGGGGPVRRGRIFGRTKGKKGARRGGVPNLAGGGSTTGAGQAMGRAGVRYIPQAVAGHLGIKDELSKDDERELSLYLERARAAGYEIKTGQIVTWRMQILLGRMGASDLWQSETGQAIEARHGPKGEQLAGPEEKPKKYIKAQPKKPKKKQTLKQRWRRFWFGRR